MEILKSWVINIATVIIFITAVEMIIPDNSIKKYAKFILGLILVSVILTPILELFNNAEEKLTDQITNYEETLNENKGNTEELNEKLKSKKFKQNLEENIQKLVKEKYEKNDCIANVDAEVDFKAMKLKIKSVTVNVWDGSIKKVEKVEIGENKKQKAKSDKENDIRNMLNKELDIPKETIEVYEN